jgi:hypothetical protein
VRVKCASSWLCYYVITSLWCTVNKTLNLKSWWVSPPVKNFFNWASGIMHEDLCAKYNVKITYVTLSPCKALEGTRWHERPALRPDHFTLEEINATTHRTGAGVQLDSRSGPLQEHKDTLSLPRFETRFKEYYKMTFHVRDIFNSDNTDYNGSHCPYLRR